MRRTEYDIVTNALGSANFVIPQVFCGEVRMIRIDGTALNQGGTADYLFKREEDGGTILSLTDVNSPWQYQPRDTLHTITGGSAVAAASNGIPVCGYIRCIVGSAKPSATAKVHIYYAED